MFSRILALASLAVLAPVLLAIALVVAMTLGRPVLFHQVRSGRGGRPFAMVKFRTMRHARRPDGALLSDEDRVSRFGRLLRRTRLDEIPGLIHVVRGEMAMVGPRPLLPATIAAWGDAGRARGRVRPGMTGWAQVNGGPLLTEQEKLALDLWYVEHRNARLDLAILVRTALVIVGGDRIARHRLEIALAGRRHRSR